MIPLDPVLKEREGENGKEGEKKERGRKWRERGREREGATGVLHRWEFCLATPMT